MLVEKDDEIRSILENTQSIAVVGCSADKSKPGHFVPAFLQGLGYRVIPVNPDHQEILGEKCYASLRDIPEEVDMVECFRPSRDIPAIADDAIAIGAKVLWTQPGIINMEAEYNASKAGMQVVMNRCPHVEIPRLLGRR